jgi:hypothetical protein
MNTINPHVLGGEHRQNMLALDELKPKCHAAVGAELLGPWDESSGETAALQRHLRADSMMRGKKTDQTVLT